MFPFAYPHTNPLTFPDTNPTRSRCWVPREGPYLGTQHLLLVGLVSGNVSGLVSG